MSGTEVRYNHHSTRTGPVQSTYTTYTVKGPSSKSKRRRKEATCLHLTLHTPHFVNLQDSCNFLPPTSAAVLLPNHHRSHQLWVDNMFRNNIPRVLLAAVLTDGVVRNHRAEAASIPDSTDQCKWDTNWDMRKPNKNKIVHQIVMVRHGQYDREGKTDAENILTSVGREQAEATGKRLDILLRSGQIQPVKNIYYSTMARATETCKIILPQISDSVILPDLPSTSTIQTNGCAASAGGESISYKTNVQACSMIREGAVCAPVPSCTGWNPSEEDFENEGIRVRSLINDNCGKNLHLFDS